MNIFQKFGKWAKKSAGKIAAVALPVAALAIPGVGGAVSNALGSVFGKKQQAAPTAPITDTDRPDSSGGLFGKGGLFGTGLAAGREWKEYNLKNKWAKQDQRMIEKAAKLLKVNVSSIEQLKGLISKEEFEALEQHTAAELAASPGGSAPSSGTSDALKYGAIGLLAAKLLGLL